jgi:hypothetical protein
VAAAAVIALDLATVLGFAVGPLAAAPAPSPLEMAAGTRIPPPLFGSRRIAPKGVSLGAFGASYRDWLGDMITVHAPALVIFEAPFVGGKTSQAVARKLMGLAFETEVVCYERGLRCMEANMADVRTHFLGKKRPGRRDAIKDATVARCRALGWMVTTDDEADACALYDYTVAVLGKTARPPARPEPAVEF